MKIEKPDWSCIRFNTMKETKEGILRDMIKGPFVPDEWVKRAKAVLDE